MKDDRIRRAREEELRRAKERKRWEAMLGVYELNRIELLRDVFVNEYFLPIMGLIFLRHAYSRYLNVNARD